MNQLETRRNVEAILTEMIAREGIQITGQTLDPATELRPLGFDSLSIVDLVLRIEDAFGLKFPDELLKDSTFATVGSLMSAIEGLAVAPINEP